MELCASPSALLWSQTGFATDINRTQTTEGKIVIDVGYSNEGSNKSKHSRAFRGVNTDLKREAEEAKTKPTLLKPFVPAHLSDEVR